MAGETYADARKVISESKAFSSGKPFLIRDLATETGMAYDFISQVLAQMVEGGQASKKRERKCVRGGIVWQYRMCNFRPRDFFAMKLRRHTNEQLGLEPLYAWSVM